jgi:hypothetical protein
VLKDDSSSSDDETVASPGISTPGLGTSSDDEKTAYKSPVTISTQRPSILSLSPDELEHPFEAETLTYLRFWLKIAWGFLVFIMADTLLLWPLPLYRSTSLPRVSLVDGLLLRSSGSSWRSSRSFCIRFMMAGMSWSNP